MASKKVGRNGSSPGRGEEEMASAYFISRIYSPPLANLFARLSVNSNGYIIRNFISVQPRNIIVRLFCRTRVLRDFPLRHPHNFSPRTPSPSPPIPRNDVLNSQRKTGRIFVENSESRRYEGNWECGYRVVLAQFTDIYRYYFMCMNGVEGNRRMKNCEVKVESRITR